MVLCWLQLFRYISGIHLAILAAFICLKNVDAGSSFLEVGFFDSFSTWPWPKPVSLQDKMMTFEEDMNEKMSWMPIRLPCSPYEFCQSNITQGTFSRIMIEFHRGHRVTRVRLLNKSTLNRSSISNGFRQ